MSSSTSYRAVCPLCQTVLVSADRGGAFVEYGVAVKATLGHLRFSCEQGIGTLGKKKAELLAENSIEVIEGPA